MSHAESYAGRDPIKFAYWVPNVSGGLVISNIEQRTSHSPEYNRELARIAERAGFDYALSQIRFTAGYGADEQHESVSFSHDLLAATTGLADELDEGRLLERIAEQAVELVSADCGLVLERTDNRCTVVTSAPLGQAWRPAVLEAGSVNDLAAALEIAHGGAAEVTPLREVDEWLGTFRAFWSQRLDALATELARGRRQRADPQLADPQRTRSQPDKREEEDS